VVNVGNNSNVSQGAHGSVVLRDRGGLGRRDRARMLM
jgi:hypothetical protein